MKKFAVFVATIVILAACNKSNETKTGSQSGQASGQQTGSQGSEPNNRSSSEAQSGSGSVYGRGGATNDKTGLGIQQTPSQQQRVEPNKQ